MAESLDIFRYVSYLRFRWLWIAGSCTVAVALALGVSLMLPPKYTAAARIVIEPPAGNDPRAAVAVSPIYLESLKTYEQFAESDSLFQKLVEQYHLRSSAAQPIESLKRKVLKVAILRNTRVMEIDATLPDARRAQQLAQSIAEATVSLSRSLVNEGDEQLLRGVEQQAREARVNLEAIETAWSRTLSEEPVFDLQSSLGKRAELRAALEQQTLGTEQEIADATERQKSAAAGEAAEARKEAGNAGARLEELRKQMQSLDAESKQRETLLSLRLSHRDRLEAERKAAEAALANIETRLREVRSEAGNRGEQLRIIDPGVVPERPSSPNLPLNVMAALLLGLALPVLYLMLELNYREHSVTARPRVYQQGGR